MCIASRWGLATVKKQLQTLAMCKAADTYPFSYCTCAEAISL